MYEKAKLPLMNLKNTLNVICTQPYSSSSSSFVREAATAGTVRHRQPL